MSELTLLLLQYGFLLVLWLFVFIVVMSLRSDVFGVKVHKLPAESTPLSKPEEAPSDAETQIVSTRRPSTGTSTSSAQATGTGGNSVSQLVITSGQMSGLEIPLGRGPITIGRSSESGLVIRDDYTSSHHARLVLWGDQWMLQDLESTNGSFVNGSRVKPDEPVALQLGDQVKIGATTFELGT
ncbi:MAG: FHA domain-containing protein [Microbacterium sp.]